MWELDYKESWGPKNWCFWTVVLEKTLESPLDCKEIQPSILKEISPEYSLEGLMLKLKLQYFGHLMWRTDSFEKTLMLGKIEGGRRRWQRMRWLYGITDSTDMSLSNLQEAWCALVQGVAKSQTQLSYWTELIWGCSKNCVTGSIELLVHLSTHPFHEHSFSHLSWETLTCGLWSSTPREMAKVIRGLDDFSPLGTACPRAHHSLQTKRNKPKKMLHWDWIGLEICPADGLAVESGGPIQPVDFSPCRFPCRFPRCPSPSASLTCSSYWDAPSRPAVSRLPAPLDLKFFPGSSQLVFLTFYKSLWH